MRRKFALCIGINDYPGTNADLKGCVNDATDWSNLLHGEGYTVQTLVDAQATKSAVVAAMLSLVGQARFADRIVVTYSGHGSWVPDRDGDEADGRDECLVLHDYDRGGLLTDDEMNEIFAARRFGVRAVVLSDSCHSGTMHRFMGTTPADGEPRFLPPASFLEGEELVRAAVVQDVQRASKSRTGSALISGCADAEYSYDAFIDGRYRGAFTAVALRTYERGQSLAKWHRRIQAELPSESYPQSPQIGATASQKRWAI